MFKTPTVQGEVPALLETNVAFTFVPETVGNYYRCVYVQLVSYVCMYSCMHACMYVCTYVCMYVCMHVCRYACMYACMHVCMYVCMYVCICLCLCRRVFCLIRDGEPVYMDFVATAYDDAQRPAPLKSTHIQAYRSRATSLRKLTPGV